MPPQPLSPKQPGLPRKLLYWATFLAACSIGETCADLVSHEFGLGYVRASALFVAAFLALVAFERHMRVPEAARYWIAIALMSTAGTALADLFTRTLGFGYAGTSVLLLTLFCGVLLARSPFRPAASSGSHDPGDPLSTHVPLQLEHATHGRKCRCLRWGTSCQAPVTSHVELSNAMQMRTEATAAPHHMKCAIELE